ncbi:MAG: hypothetical protein HC887_06325 [Desulfobacteraceae bacterium]|nr:hypothetical protein [Desulfobacteraceae bacterium]
MKATKFFSTLLLTMLVCTICLQIRFLEDRFPKRVAVPECPWCDAGDTSADVVYLPVSTSVMRLFAPADPNFLADMIWMRTTYYFGKHVLTDRQYPYLLHLLDMITDLAPRWENPYLFGAIALPTETQIVADGLYLIDKGLSHHPQNWMLWFFKGYYFWKSLNDMEKASEALYKASTCPEAPAYLANLSAKLATQAGKRELAIRFLQESIEK